MSMNDKVPPCPTPLALETLATGETLLNSHYANWTGNLNFLNLYCNQEIMTQDYKSYDDSSVTVQPTTLRYGCFYMPSYGTQILQFSLELNNMILYPGTSARCAISIGKSTNVWMESPGLFKAGISTDLKLVDYPRYTFSQRTEYTQHMVKPYALDTANPSSSVDYISMSVTNLDNLGTTYAGEGIRRISIKSMPIDTVPGNEQLAGVVYQDNTALRSYIRNGTYFPKAGVPNRISYELSQSHRGWHRHWQLNAEEDTNRCIKVTPPSTTVYHPLNYNSIIADDETHVRVHHIRNRKLDGNPVRYRLCLRYKMSQDSHSNTFTIQHRPYGIGAAYVSEDIVLTPRTDWFIDVTKVLYFLTTGTDAITEFILGGKSQANGTETLYISNIALIEARS